MTETALYHPYIRPRDDAWLKVAALSWPRIARLKPPSHRGPDRGGVKALADAGILVSQDPTAAAQVISQPFTDLIEE